MQQVAVYLLFIALALVSCWNQTTTSPDYAEGPEAEQVVILEESASTTTLPSGNEDAEPISGAASHVRTPAEAPFDYYVLALSWSPQHCATPAGQRDDVQCSGPRSFGFIAHGLWPQFERGWPQDCPSAHSLPQQVLRTAMDIMPSPGLIRHQWRKHGTCTGLTPEDYFAVTRQAFQRFRVPDGYGTPTGTLNVAPAVYKQAVIAANPSLNSRNLALICSGRFFQELRICLDKDLNPRPCGSGVRDRCRVPEMIIRPVR